MEAFFQGVISILGGSFFLKPNSKAIGENSDSSILKSPQSGTFLKFVPNILEPARDWGVSSLGDSDIPRRHLEGSK